jgi:hypothetical protein
MAEYRINRHPGGANIRKCGKGEKYDPTNLETSCAKCREPSGMQPCQEIKNFPFFVHGGMDGAFAAAQEHLKSINPDGALART